MARVKNRSGHPVNLLVEAEYRSVDDNGFMRPDNLKDH